MQQNPHENTPPSSPIFSTGTQTTATTVVMPPSSTALPHTFDTKGISDIESLPASSSLDRRHREEKKMSTITPATTASSSKPEDEEGDSDLDKLLMESPTTTGSSVRRHHGTSSLRFGSTHSGYSDSGIFETSSPGSTATHSLARSSTTTSKKKQNIRPVVRDMYSEYTTSTPRWEDAMMVERGKTVLSTISIKLRPTMDASISTDDFYFPLDASVLLPAQSAAPLIMNRATISTPTLSLTTVPFPSSSRSDQQTQTELRPLKTKRKSTKHILLFHPSHYSVKTRVEPVPSHAHGTSDQLCAEQTVDLGTSVLAPAGVILVKSTTAATSTAAMEAKPVNQALRETAHGKGKRGEEEEDMEVSSAVAAIQDSTSAEESADSMEASWYQPHLHLSDQTKRFHRKIRRKYKDAEEDMDIGGKKDSKAEQYVKRKGSGDEKRKEEDQKLAFNKGIPKDGINKMEKERQGEKRVKGQREDINKKDVIEIKEKDIRTPQFYLQIKEHGEYKENEKAERKRNDKTTKYTTEAEEEQRKNSLRKLHKYQKKLKGFNMPQIKIKSKVRTPHEELKPTTAKKEIDEYNAETKRPESPKDVSMYMADAPNDIDGNVVGRKKKIPYFKAKVPNPHMKVEGKVEAELEMPDLSADVPAVSGGMELPEVDLNLDSDIVPSVAVATPSMKLDAAAVDIDVPKANVELPHVEAKGDISLMEMEASVPWPEIEGDMPKAKVAVEKELKLPSVHMKAPKFKLGKKGKGKAEGGEVETRQLVVHGERPRVDVGKPKAEVDVEMPSGKVAVEKDIQSPDFHFKMPKMKFGGKVKKPHVEVETPEVEAHVDVPGVEVDLPEGQIDIGLPVVDACVDVDGNGVGGNEKIPSFKVKVPKPHMKVEGKVEAELEMPDLSADVPAVSGGMELPEVDLNLDSDIVPSVAVATPSMKLDAAAVDIDVPKANVELPHVEAKGDISLMEMEASVPWPEIEGDMPKAKVAVEKELKLPSVHMKAPKFKLGKKGKGKAEGGEVETRQLVVHGERPRVDVGKPKAEVDVEMPSGKVAVEKDIQSPDFHFKMPKMKFGGKVKKPHVEVGTPEVEAHVDVPGVEVGMPEGHLADGMRNLESIRPALDPRTHEIIPISSVAVVVPGNVPLKPRRQFLHLDSGAISREKNMAVFEGIPRDSYMAFDLPSSKFGLIFDIPSPKEAEIFRESCFPTEINSSSDMTASELESSSHSGSLPISPRDFCAHSTTPEFKRSSGVQTIVEECSGTAERKKSEKNMLDWFRSSWRRNKRRRSGVSTLSGVEDGRSPSNRGRWRRKPLKYKKTTVQSTAATLITSTPVENEDLGIQADVVLTTQFSVSLPRSRYQQSEGKSAEPALPREAELLWAEQKTAELPVEFLKTLGSTKTKSKKKSTKPTILDQSLIKAEPNASTPRLRKSSSSLPSERLQRQTWHHPEVAISSIIDANSRTPPKSSLSPRLDDDISEWFSHAHRSHYGDTSPLRKPRPWSTLDYPPQNCTFLNDDHLFPYSITPTKLPSCRWKSDKEYDVPYIDDDALPLDEPEWALGESRRTLTLTSADADFWRTAIAEEERSEASGESEWASKRHLKKYRSLVPYHFKVKNRDQPSRTPKLVKPPVEGTDQSFRKELETTHHQETPQTHY